MTTNYAGYLKRSVISYHKRVVTLLEKLNLTEEFEQESLNFQKEVSSGWHPEDTGGFYDMCQQHYEGMADEYNMLEFSLHSALIANIYHLWEKDCKSLILYIFRFHPIMDGMKLIGEEEIFKASLKRLKEILVFYGMTEAIFTEIETLSYLVNACKHGSGNSATILAKRDAELHSKIYHACDVRSVRGYDSGTLKKEDVLRFTKAVEHFWAEAESKLGRYL